MAAVFKWYKIFFTRPATGGRPGRPERDVNVEKLRRFVSQNGIAGDLDSIAPSAGFGILEVRCTETLARRVADMPEVETVRER